MKVSCGGVEYKSGGLEVSTKDCHKRDRGCEEIV